jgi:D-cysteine desulfhydrase
MRRFALARLPTPLEPAPRLTDAWGGPRLWIKRDDLTGFGLSGNKARKLEFHLGGAFDAGARTVITCGALQSNHCRATALAADRLGLDAVLLLRTVDGREPKDATGNHLLQRLAGAVCRFIDPDQWQERDALMAEAAAEFEPAWVIPEGGSDALGLQGFVVAAAEVATQLEEAGVSDALVWHAASSGGTTAGLIRGSADHPVEIVGASVGETAGVMSVKIGELLDEADQRYGSMPRAAHWSITDEFVGNGYGVATEAELALQVEATRLTGLLWDPTYTGKALYGLHQRIRAGAVSPDRDIVFWHTGGGFATFATAWGPAIR